MHVTFYSTSYKNAMGDCIQLSMNCKNKINLLHAKLPSVTSWTNKPNDTQTADTKPKEGNIDDINK